MVNKRRLLSLGLTLGLFFSCLVLSSHTPTVAREPGEKHPVLHKALKDLHDGTGRLLVGGFRDGSLRPDHDGRQAEEPNQRQRA